MKSTYCLVTQDLNPDLTLAHDSKLLFVTNGSFIYNLLLGGRE